MKRIRLRTRFVVLMLIIMATSLLLSIIWSNATQKKQAELEMHEKAYVLSQQLDAVWEFMAINQDLINYDDNGEYNFKGLHCSLVGKSIGKLFGKKTGYLINYTNFNPRNKADRPDEFETRALNAFKENRDLKEFSCLTTYGDKQVFRYVVPMRIDESCLECHGEPKGEPDVLGFPREGWRVGELGGALSIIMPIDIYLANAGANVISQVSFFSVLTLFFVLLVYFATSKLVTKPLNKFKNSVEQIKKGNLKIDLEDIDAVGEIRDLAIDFEEMAKELQDLYYGLESEVELRTRDLAEANSILEDQRIELEEINVRLIKDNQYKSDFLAIMSHELRTPLTSIIAFAELLEKTTTSKKCKDEKVVQEIKNNSKILLGMINNILELAKLEAGKMDLYFELLDLVDVINAVENVVTPLADKKQITLITDVDLNVPLILGDQEALRRVVENLVSNAIKFTPEKGKVEVKVTCNPEQNEVIISVEDNGIGISEEDKPLIFEKFVQSDTSVYRKYSGSGLGLAVAKELVELHGGWIKVKSEIDKGSIFVVGIPINGGEDTDENYAGR
ncbi:MAG: DUF3365 domain-containing protein [Bacillota bacterium]